METEILWCVLGLMAGIAAGRYYKNLTAKKQNTAFSLAAVKASRLEKLLHNIESYDGTDKNQLHIGIEEE